MSGRHRKSVPFPWTTLGAVATVVAVSVAVGYFFLRDDAQFGGTEPPTPTASASNGEDGEGQGDRDGTAPACPGYRSAAIQQLQQAGTYQQQVILFVEQALRGEEPSAIVDVIGQNLGQVEAAFDALGALGPPPTELAADVTALQGSIGEFTELARSYEQRLRTAGEVPSDAADRLTDLYESQLTPNQVARCS